MTSIVKSCSSVVLTSVVMLGVAALVGASIPTNIAVITGLALVGIALAIRFPIDLFMTHRVNNITDAKAKAAFACFSLLVTGLLFFALVPLSHYICQSIPSLPNFSLIDAYKFAGITYGLIVATGTAFTCCLCCCAAAAAPYRDPY